MVLKSDFGFFQGNPSLQSKPFGDVSDAHILSISSTKWQLITLRWCAHQRSSLLKEQVVTILNFLWSFQNNETFNSFAEDII